MRIPWSGAHLRLRITLDGAWACYNAIITNARQGEREASHRISAWSFFAAGAVYIIKSLFKVVSRGVVLITISLSLNARVGMRPRTMSERVAADAVVVLSRHWHHPRVALKNRRASFSSLLHKFLPLIYFTYLFFPRCFELNTWCSRNQDIS